MIQLTKFMFMLVATLAVMSCAKENPMYPASYGHNDLYQNQPSNRMAGARGINATLINDDLDDLVSQTQEIEMQISSLLTKLENLREKIEIHKESKDAIAPLMVNEPQIKAQSNPTTILPVPERPQIIHEIIRGNIQPEKNTRPAAKPLPRKTPPKTETNPVTQSSSNKNGVIGIRTGIHADKTRLVFDINGSTKHSIDFDKEAGIITMSLPDTSWATTDTKTYNLSQLAGYQAKQTGQGTIVALSVKNTKSIRTETIKKTGGKPARFIVDLIK